MAFRWKINCFEKKNLFILKVFFVHLDRSALSLLFFSIDASKIYPNLYDTVCFDIIIKSFYESTWARKHVNVKSVLHKFFCDGMKTKTPLGEKTVKQKWDSINPMSEIQNGITSS